MLCSVPSTDEFGADNSITRLFRESLDLDIDLALVRHTGYRLSP